MKKISFVGYMNEQHLNKNWQMHSGNDMFRELPWIWSKKLKGLKMTKVRMTLTKVKK